MNNTITNTANTTGTFDTRETALSSTIVTALTDDLSIEKTANKEMWADGTLTYTVVVTNASATLPYVDVTFTDIIDPTIATLVENSVTLNGVAVAYMYEEATGLLTVAIGDVPVASNATIVFEVSKI